MYIHQDDSIIVLGVGKKKQGDLSTQQLAN